MAELSGINASIPLQTRVPSLDQALSPISTMLDIQRKQQGVQIGEQQIEQAKQGTESGAISLAQKQYEIDTQKRIGQAMQDPANKLPDGTPDLNKLAGVLYQADPRNTMASRVLSEMAAGKSNLVAFKSNYANLTQQQQDIFNRSMVGLLNDPKADKNTVRQTILDQRVKLGDDSDDMYSAFEAQLAKVPNKPEAVQAFIRTSLAHTAGATALGQATGPNGPTVSDNATTKVVNQNPMSPMPMGATVPGTAATMQLPPTTPTVTQTPGGGWQPTYLGTPGQRPPSGQVPSAPPMGTGGNIENINQEVGADAKVTQERAADAQRSIPVLQKIKQYAEGAATGVTGERESLIAALAGRLGMDSQELKRANTEVLAKNSNMLALAGGNTDLARTLAEVSNPNAKMTKEAINITANQLIASAQLDLAKQNYMQTFRNDPQSYKQGLAEWNKMANPNALMFPQLTQEERGKLKSSMNAQQQKTFAEQLRWAQQKGLIQ